MTTEGRTIDTTLENEGATSLAVVVNATKAAAFTSFVASTNEALYRSAHLLAGNHYRAEELVQQTYERVWRRWDWATVDDPAGYAWRTLFNLRIASWRRTRREVLLARMEGEPIAGAEVAVAERDRISRAVAALPPKQRRAVVLRYLLDMSEADTAETLGVARGTVKSNASRGLSTLRRALREEPTHE
ncbi:SigE family RNA polymerase sigma factor [Oerskovia sp. M15]